MTWNFQPHLQCIQSTTGKFTEAAQTAQTGGKGIAKTCTVMRKGKELNKNIGSKSLHHFVQRLLMPSVRQQVAKPQVLMRSQQNFSKKEARHYGTECTECVWRSGKLVTGQSNGRSPHSSHFPRKLILNCVQITEQLLLSPMQVRSFFGSYCKGSEWRLKRKLQMNMRDSDKEGEQEIRSRISIYWCTRHASTNYMCFVDFKKAFHSISNEW